MFEMNDAEKELDIEHDDTDAPDELELVDVEEQSEQKMKKLRTELTLCTDEKQQIREELQRAKAEFLNARKRLEEERDRDRERTVNTHLERLLPVCDSFDLALLHEPQGDIDETWKQGLASIKGQLQALLSSYGVTTIHPKGEPFDPNNHEAVANVPVDDPKQNGIIIAVLQPGYERTYSGKTELIRAARVSVGTYKS